ncbi:hypothetical protein D3C87_159330 [compost metagenome]
MKKLLLLCAFVSVFSIQAQEGSVASKNEIIAVDTSSIATIAKNSDKKNTLFFTFGIWCEPCRLHLPGAIKLAKENDLDFYVLLVDGMNTENVAMGYQHIKKLDPTVKVAVLNDAVYGEKLKKRNKKFVTEITPPQFENIDDFSKYILLNNEGEVILVTTWKDNRDNDWRDDTKMQKEKIIPLLSK